jgi:hypothetical protein
MPEDFSVEEEAASSTPWAANRPAPVAATVLSAWQHTPAQTSRASRAAPGALSAARELLRHPPSSTALPGAMKQWRDDVDRLLGIAHSGSARPRPRSSRRQHEASASVRSPSVRAALTEDLRVELNRRRAREDAPVSLERSSDLRAELNHRRAGEDARVSLKRARERRQNVEGRNLDYDFAVVAPQTPMGARIKAGVPLAGVGCAALADHLYAATWPSKFWPHVPEEVRQYVKSIGILAGVRHRYYGSRWRHRRNDNILPSSLVGASLDLAHEPYPGINLLLGKALRAVHSELRQRLSTAWRGGPPPRSEAGVRGNSLGVYLPLHQGTRHYNSYFRCFHHHRFPPGST